MGEEVIHRLRDIVHTVYLYVSACSVRKYNKLCALVRYSYIYKGSPKASGIIPIIEMLSILLKSPKQSVPDYPSSVNPGKSTKGQYYLPGLWVDKWPPINHQELTMTIVYFTGLERAGQPFSSQRSSWPVFLAAGERCEESAPGCSSLPVPSLSPLSLK